MNAKKKERIIIFDTTLRDGEQSPGASMTHREKVELARELAKLGVDIIEAGFPIASEGDFQAVRDVAATVKGPAVAGLARCVNRDIERCAEAVGPARKSRIHVFLATSRIHRKYKLRKARAEILKQAVSSVKYARTFCDDVEFSPEDASRTEPDFLAEVVKAVIGAGAGTVNIPDTVGYAIPSEFGNLIAYLYEHVSNINEAVISVHCHNDLGLAVANSLAAVENGARGIECTVNGIGERAGNAALEEIVMAVKTRSDHFAGVETAVKTDRIYKISRMVSRITGLTVQRNKAIVGANAFAHEAGVHQDGMLKERRTYEIMRAEDIGIPGTDIVLGKHSGRHAVRHRLTELGIKPNSAEMERLYCRFKEVADKKKHVYDSDLLTIAHEEMFEPSETYVLDYLHVSAGTGTIPTATVRLKKGKDIFQEAAAGDGPVDAAFKTIDRISGQQGKLVDYSIQAVTVGKDAMGEVSLRMLIGSDVFAGKAASTDIIEASVKAYLSCVNRAVALSEDSSAGQLPSGRKRTRKKRK
ncbi:MAG: 2-isopropylmalate synthase [Kiritimatiellia bacterium]